MKRMNLHLIYILLFCSLLPTQLLGNDSIRLSLLTCGAGQEVYSLYGHTAIRCENFTRGTDVVYNYGVFDFDAPNFIWRFTLGETDYLLGKSKFSHFAAAYYYAGREVRQQVLNLTQEEKERLVAQLEENYLPANRTYRYNFFYDNCATRPRDQVERAVSGELRYADDMTSLNTGNTFRSMLHQYNSCNPWSRFGVDLCLGVEADKPISRRQMMFVPFCVEEFFSKAEIIDNQGNTRPLAGASEELVTPPSILPDGRTFTPLQAALLLLILTLGCTIYGIRSRRMLWGVDLLLLTAAGLAGCILAFLALFSQHPAVGQNYLLLVFHPLHLFCLPWVVKRLKRGQRSRYLMLNLIVLTFFILFWSVIPQRFPLTVLPLTLCLWARSLNNLIITYKRPS